MKFIFIIIGFIQEYLAFHFFNLSINYSYFIIKLTKSKNND